MRNSVNKGLIKSINSFNIKIKRILILNFKSLACSICKDIEDVYESEISKCNFVTTRSREEHASLPTRCYSNYVSILVHCSSAKLDNLSYASFWTTFRM